MSSAPITTSTAPAWPWWRFAIAALSLLAVALSGYLSWHYLAGGKIIGCGGGNSCDQVLSSRWSSIGGVLPVSGLAMGAYLAIFIASLSIGPGTPAADRRLAWGAMLLLAWAVIGSALWFIIAQRWLVGAFCPYCMATHITGLLLAALIIWRVPKKFAENSVVPPTVPPAEPLTLHKILGPLPAIGLVLAGVLAACQISITPPAVYRGGVTTQTNTSPTIDPHAAPIVGSPDASYIVNVIFDYNCPHCQKLHGMLEEAITRYHGKVAFTLCPAPLSSRCNPFIPRELDEFKSSCELARIGLTVWAADPKAFAAFDHWMFTPEPDRLWHPRTLESAQAKAVELLGQSKFDAAQADPKVDRHLQNSIRLYGDTVPQGGNAVPKLVYRSRWVTPEPRDTDDLISILWNSLAIPQP